MIRWLQRLACAIAIHDWEFVGERFVFCLRPQCMQVEHRSEDMHFELDICDSRWEYYWYDVPMKGEFE